MLISSVASAKRQALRDWPWLPSFFLDLLRSPFDTATHVKRAKCPVLVVHGANDRVVPISQAQEVYNAARSPKRLIVAPEAGHGATSETTRPISTG